VKRICTKCKRPILKTHRWHQRWHHLIFWHWRSYAHHNCLNPYAGPGAKRLDGEVPLPFPEAV
jgi:hypothetical protein